MKKKLIALISVVFALSLSLSCVFGGYAESNTAVVHTATRVEATDASVGYYNPKGVKYGSFPGVSNLIAKEEFTFEGTGIGVVGIGSPGHALGTVFVDNEQVGTADFASASGQTEFFRKLDLESGEHTVRVEIPSGSWVQFDGFYVYNSAPSYDTVERIDDGTDGYSYIGDDGNPALAWSSSASAGALNGTVSAIGSANNAVTYTFEGVGVGVIARDHDPAWGTTIEISVDGTVLDTVVLKGNTGIHEVFRTLGLSDGTHTVKIRTTEGGFLEFDGLNIYKKNTPKDLQSTRIDDAQTVKTPESAWFETASDKYEGGKAVWNTGSSGIETSYTFEGVGVGVYLDGVSQNEGTEWAGGLCSVVIDGVTRAVIDTRTWTGLIEAYTVTDLEDGQHTVRLIKLDNGNITFDGFRVYANAGSAVELEETVIEENNAALVFSTSAGVTSAWPTTAGGIAGGNGTSVFVGGACETSAVELPFVGTGIGITAQGQADAATFEVFIDGVSYGEVDLSSKTGFSEVFAEKGLENRMHLVKMVVTKGGWCVLDSFTVYAPKAETGETGKWDGYAETIVNNNDATILYNEQWVRQTDKVGYIGNDYHFCGNNVESTINYTFSGVGIEILAQRQAAGGTFKVYIDEEEVATVDLTELPYEPSAVVFSSNLLENGSHSIRIERVLNGADKYIVFDAFKVIKLSEDVDVDADDYVLQEPEIGEGYQRKEKAYNAVNTSAEGFADTGRSYVSCLPGAVYIYEFRGIGMEILASLRSDGGKFNVKIDGLDYGTVNTYADSRTDSEKVFAVSGLKLGVHRAEITVAEEQSPLSSGTYVELRGVSVIAKEGVDEDNIDPDYDDYVLQGDGSFDPEIYEQETLDAEELHSMSAGFGIGPNKDYITTSANNSTVTIVFRGTGIELYAEVNAAGAKFEVYIDGVFKGKVNTFDVSNPQTKEVVFREFGMDNDEHVVEIVKIAEKSIAAPETTYLTLTKAVLLKVIGDVDTSQKINSDHYNISSEGFGVDRNDGYYGGDALFGNFFGSYVEFRFKGTGVKWFGSRNTDNGVASVYLDGELVATVDTYAESYILSTQLWKITGLENTNHTLRLVVEAEYNLDQYKSYITVDYFVVYDYEDLEFEGYPEIPDDEVVNPSEPPSLPERRPGDAEISQSGGGNGLPVYSIVLIGIGCFAVLGGISFVLTSVLLKRKAK